MYHYMYFEAEPLHVYISRLNHYMYYFQLFMTNL